jgi:hypothetical protein
MDLVSFRYGFHLHGEKAAICMWVIYDASQKWRIHLTKAHQCSLAGYIHEHRLGVAQHFTPKVSLPLRLNKCARNRVILGANRNSLIGENHQIRIPNPTSNGCFAMSKGHWLCYARRNSAWRYYQRSTISRFRLRHQ